ncbi:MAG TPA: alpha/beta hydrolase [Burkholderiales bacterium]|nr:alpha/beta hydrolase [Burkholderiales bacterium]
MARRAPAVLLAMALAAMQAHPATTMKTGITSTSFLTSDGVRLHVLEACPPGAPAPGSLSPVIGFVPGWSMPAAIWREQLLALGAKHCVAALDPRGQGESEIAPGGYTLARRAEDLREFAARYPRLVLVGWSLGALEALEYVHRHGAAGLEALVLVDTSVGEDPQPPSAGGFFDALKNDRRAAVEDFVRATFRSPRAPAEIAALTDAALRLPLEASLSLFPRSTPREHWRGIARAFPKPLLYVVSAQFAAQAETLKRNRPGTRVAVFEDAGHALFVDEPGRFNALLAQFVADIEGPARAAH